MSAEVPWSELPETRRAASVGDYGKVLRIARTAARLTLSRAGERCGYSAATLSRLERGRQPLTDVTVLRRLAEVFDIPPALFGLGTGHGPAFPGIGNPVDTLPKRGTSHEVGESPMRRREVLGGLAAVVGASLPGAEKAVATPPLQLVASLEEVLLGSAAPTSGPVDRGLLQATLSAAWSDFHACRYARLTARLPQLVATATAGHATADPADRASMAGLLTRAYLLTTQVLSKLHEDGMAWSAMDRASRAAREADQPLLTAETARVSATVLRRSRHQQRAEQVVLSAAQALDQATGLTSTGQVAVYGRLLATAAYTAAVADRRSTAWDLLGEADEAARRSGRDDGFADVDVALYRISVARVLGDFGAAVQHARALRPETLGSIERRVRYWQDTALALYGRGAYAESYRALLAAEQTAPQEVRYRPWTQQLTSALLSADRSQALPGLRNFAARTGTPT